MRKRDAEIVEQIPRLRRYARALTGDADAADDLVQDCLERAWSRLHLWRRGSSMRIWLFTIMHNLYVNGVRRTRARPRIVPLKEWEPGARVGPRQEETVAARTVVAALDRLPDEQRQAVLLVGLEQFTYREAAGILGIPIGTVMSRLSRGRERLRALVGVDGGERIGGYDG